MSGQLRFIDSQGNSDGDGSHVPYGRDCKLYDPPTLYLDKLGTAWMESRGRAKPGVTYRLRKLPHGYTVWEKPRLGNAKHVDRWCYGHPSHKSFDSPNRFLPHFLTVMGNTSPSGCRCINCAKPSAGDAITASTRTPLVIIPSLLPTRPRGRPPGRPPIIPPSLTTTSTEQKDNEDSGKTESGVYKAKGRQWVEGRVDEEGTPDPYRNNIDKLKKSGSIDTIIEEKMSADWRAERSSHVAEYFNKLRKKPAWLPRRMEIVLFVRSMQDGDTLIFDEASKRFMVSSKKNESLLSLPNWEAGLVTQTIEEDCDLTEVLHAAEKRTSIATSGVRIEPISNANEKDNKGVWKRYKYCSLHQVRPFALWRNFLAGIDTEDLHTTITNSMLVMSTLTLVNRYRFKGKWPTAQVYCRAMYLGAELILEGDYVYLIPEDNFEAGVVDILRIETITLALWNLDTASADDYDEGHPYNSTARVTGIVYTLSKERAASRQSVDGQLASAGLDRYGPWYPRTPLGKVSRLPFSRIMGRCYNAQAIDLWLHGKTAETPLARPGTGVNGITSARKYSSATYRRIGEGNSWFWADTRVEALDLQEVNGVLVESRNPDRNPKDQRKAIRLIDGVAQPHERLAMPQQTKRASTRNNGMVISALNADVVQSVETSTGRKRDRNALGRSDDGDSDDNESDEGDGQKGEEHDGGNEGTNYFTGSLARNLGLPMSDEEIPSDEDEDEEEEDQEESISINATERIRPKPTAQPMIIID